MPATESGIRHVVVLMLENRSFDHMLGSLQAEIPELDGINPAEPVRTNKANGKSYSQAQGAVRIFPNQLDPKHEFPSVTKQVAVGKMTGFAQDFADSHPHAQRDDIQQVMACFRPGELPALHALARQFTVCDRWFSSVPGPTWPNRFFAHSGTSLGHLAMPEGLFNLHLHWYSQDTIYDRLNASGKSWNVYYGDIPQSALLVHQLKPRNMVRYHHLDRFFEDAERSEEQFPLFAFLEPEYYPPGANDDHPPHDVLNGDRLLADVYNAIRHNDALFSTTLLVVVWDEHGGFYDHVPPPPIEPPDHHSGEFDFNFRSLGVRVPAVLVSPWTAKGVCHTVFDHTSILRYVMDTHRLAPLGNRVATANSIGEALLKTPRSLAELPGSIQAISPLNVGRRISIDTLNANQQGLVGYTQYLASLTKEDPVKTNERNTMMLTSARAQIDIACDHVDCFVREQHEAATVPSSLSQPDAK